MVAVQETGIATWRRSVSRLPVQKPLRTSRWWGAGILLLPAVVAIGIFFFYPVWRITWGSVASPRLGFENYTAIFDNPSSIDVLTRTFVAGAVVAGLCLIIGFPYAYMMTRVSRNVRAVMTLIVLLPFWTSLMARNFAWLLLEERGGLIERAFSLVGMHVVLLGTVAGVVVAMVQVMLPYMILPLYSVMATINMRLVDAASVCGAARWRAFLQVYLPLTMPGVIAGLVLVFVLSLGFYITPALLGSPFQSLIAQTIGFKVDTVLTFPGAGAYGALLLAVTLVLMGLAMRGLRLINASPKVSE